MKIILIGYMASGKSLIGNELAKVLKLDFLDLDDYIEEKEGKTVQKIFSEKGEIYFRKIENHALNELISSNKSYVLSLGGGTPCFSNNLNLLNKSKYVKTIFLNVPINELVNRLMLDKENRPLVKFISDRDNMLEFVGKHLFERMPFYSQADYTVAANKPKEDVVQDIIVKLF